MKKINDSVNIKAKAKPKKHTALKVFVASVLGLGLLLTTPATTELVRSASQTSFDNYQNISGGLYDSASNKVVESDLGSTATGSTATGATSSTVATNTGTLDTYTGSGLDASKLQTSDSVSGNWVDDFSSFNTTQLTALTREEGNIFKDSEGATRKAYHIYDANEFAFLSAFVKSSYTNTLLQNQTFYLEADIDLAGKEWTPIFNMNNTVTSFSVIFDGQNHTIKNVYIYDSQTKGKTDTYASIFGCWGLGTIKNLTIENANIQSWKSASIIANKNTSYNLASDVENITLKNCKVVACDSAAGLTFNAKSIKDCYMENCEILSTDSDADLLGNDYVYGSSSYTDSVLNTNRSHYVYGFGRALAVTNSNTETKTVGLKNCKIGFVSDIANYNPLTRSTTRSVRVYGISNWDSSGETAEYSNITIDNCEICADAKIGDSSGNATVGSNNYPFNQNFTTEVYGVARYGTNLTDVTVTLSNINVTNSKIYSSFDYNPTDTNNNKDMFFQCSSMNVAGISSVSTYNPNAGSTLYKNITVDNCDIYEYGNVNYIVQPTYSTTNSTNNYITDSLSGNVVGISYISTQTSGTSKLENCKVQDSNITSTYKFKAINDTNYYANISSLVSGMTHSPNSYDANFSECVVDNCNIVNTTDIDNGTYTGTIDYNNPTNQNDYAFGMGVRGYYDNCKVTNSNIQVIAKDTKDTTKDSRGGINGNVHVCGLGGIARGTNAYIKNSTVDKCTLTADADQAYIYMAGLIRDFDSSNYGYTMSNNKLINTTITTKTYNRGTYVGGLAYSSVNYSSSSDSNIKVTDNTVENVKADITTPTGETYGTFGVYNAGYVSNELNVKQNTLKNSSSTINATKGTIRWAGLLYNGSQIGTTTNGVTTGKISFDDNTIDSITMATKDKSAGTTILTAGMCNNGSANIELSGNNLSNVVLSNDIAKATSTAHSYMSGLVYTDNTRVANNVSEITDNVCNNLTLTNKVNGTTDIYHEIYTSGMIYSNSAAIIQAENNTVKNSNITSQSNVGSVYAVGMMMQRADRKSTLNECYAYNNIVTSTFERGGSNSTSRSADAYGLAGYYVASVTNCVVGSGRVIAHNDMTTAIAAGVAATRGLAAINYTSRSSSTDIWYTEIDNCFNFAEVSAETENSSAVSYAAGIGRAEIVTNCANYGNVTANYAGGIVTGYVQTGTNSRYPQYSFGLTIKNCVNAGDICRSDTGGQSFIGGIVARYEMRYYTQHKFILENNVSLGGVYSAYNETTDEYSQIVTTATFMGMLYGYLSIPSISDMDTIYDTISIKNNYILVDAENGINAGFVYADTTLSTMTLPVAINTPSTNYIASTEGIFYRTSNINANKTTYEDMITKCMSADSDNPSNSNILINKAYTASTFAKTSAFIDNYTDDNWAEWTMPTGNVPQIATSLSRLIVRYDLGEYNGVVPAVEIVQKGDTEYTYTLSNGRVAGDDSASIINQTGVSLSQWTDGTTTYNLSQQVVRATNGVITYTANVGLTTYTFVVNDAPENITITFANNDKTVTLETDSREITATGNDSLSVTGYTLLAQNVETNNYDILQVLTADNKTATFNLANFVNADFLTKYATTADKINIKIDYKISATYNGVDAFTNNAPENSQLKITVTADSYYSLTSVKVNNEDKTLVDNSTTMTVTANVNIVVSATKIQYGINIMLQNLQGVTLDSDLVNTLITNPTETMSVDSYIPSLQARKDVVGYRFVGWKLFGMNDNLADTDGIIDEGYTVAQSDFARYLSVVNSETKFNIIAIYQRQYQFNVTLNNEYGDAFASEYELCYTDENGVAQALTNAIKDEEGNVVSLNPSGNYLIDESTFIQLKVIPNKRVRVIEPTNEQFGNNIVYVYLTGNKDITLDFEVRPLTITSSVLNVEKPTNNEGLPANQLVSAITYQVKSADGEVIGSEVDSAKLNIDNKVQFGFNSSVLSNSFYRFVEIRLLNVNTGNYDVVPVDASGEIEIGDAFFTNYVNSNGEVAVSMKVIKQYNTEVVAENLVSDDNYNLGSYTFEILDEDGQPADSTRYTADDANNDSHRAWVMDNGLRLVIVASADDYAEFAGFSGVFAGEATSDTNAVAVINDNRSINIRFEKSTYSLKAPYDATAGGKLAFTDTFKLGDTISISYTPENNYQITNWTLAGKSLSDWGAAQNGNTITVVATKEFLDAVQSANLLSGGELTLDSDIETIMSPTLMYGIIGGGVAILVLVIVIVLLLLRSRRLKLQKEENEKKLNDIMRKFNVADMIKDLKK